LDRWLCSGNRLSSWLRLLYLRWLSSQLMEWFVSSFFCYNFSSSNLLDHRFVVWHFILLISFWLTWWLASIIITTFQNL
jgi:hypothetical protein